MSLFPFQNSNETSDCFVASIRGLHVSYGHRVALYDLSLDIVRQEVVVLIGPNGSGKSTLLRAIAGFISTTRGEIWLGDTEVTKLSPHERAKLGISYLMQGGRVFPSLTVEENIELGAAMLPKSSRVKNIEMVQSLFPHLIGQSRIHSGLLSGGDRRSLAIALALLRKPRLLLLDEPTAGLAPSLTQNLMDKLKEIKRAWDLSVLLVAHNMREALSISDRVVAIVNGRKINLKAPEALLSSQYLKEIFSGERIR